MLLYLERSISDPGKVFSTACTLELTPSLLYIRFKYTFTVPTVSPSSSAMDWLVARDRAREMGHRQGALFPWRTISGTECSSFFPSGTAQYHISADIAYSYIQYYLAEQDRDFLLSYGAEVLIETARLWADIGHYYNGAFHIDEVTGQDYFYEISHFFI